MAVVSQRVSQDVAQADGRRRVIYEYTDHLGALPTLGPMLVPSGFDTAADLVARIPSVEESQRVTEEAAFSGDASTASFNYTTKKRVIKKLLTEALRDDNPKHLLLMKPVIDWLRANYTGVQIATYLGITIAKASALAARYDAIVLIKASLDADVAEDM